MYYCTYIKKSITPILYLTNCHRPSRHNLPKLSIASVILLRHNDRLHWVKDLQSEKNNVCMCTIYDFAARLGMNFGVTT